MTRFSEAMGRQVVSTSTAATVGRVDDFVIDPRTHVVVAVTLKKADDGDTLRWSDITAFGGLDPLLQEEFVHFVRESVTAGRPHSGHRRQRRLRKNAPRTIEFRFPAAIDPAALRQPTRRRRPRQP